MGVNYKITDEVLAFIVQRKKSRPKISCQDIADEILIQFETKVSKSSVHEALKHAGVVSARPTTGFTIPNDTKVKISLDVAKRAGDLIPAILAKDAAAVPLAQPHVSIETENVPVKDAVIFKEDVVPAFVAIPAPEHALRLMPDPIGVKEDAAIEAPVSRIELVTRRENAVPAQEQEARTETVRGPVTKQAGAVFLKALAWEMGLERYEDYKESEFGYRTHVVQAYQLEFNGRSPLYLDPQLRTARENFMLKGFGARFLPRAVMEACDKIVYNCKALIIDDLGNINPDLSGLVRVALLDQQGAIIVQYGDLLDIKRAISPSVAATRSAEGIPFDRIATINDISSIESMAYSIFGDGLTVAEFSQVIEFEGFVLKSPQGERLYLVLPDDYPHTSLVQARCAQLRTLGFWVELITSSEV